MSSWLNFIFKTIGLIICFLFYSRMRGFSMLWVIFERNLKEVFLLAVWVSDIREIILCNEKWKICLCTRKSNIIGWYECFSGAKFGDYGSFLPTCERSPPLRSCPKTPQKHSSSPKSPSNLHMVVYQNLLLFICFFVHWMGK